TMADVNINAPAGQAPAMAPLVRPLLLPQPYHRFTSSSSGIQSNMTRQLGATVNNNQPFISPPSSDVLINFVNELGYPKLVRNLSNVVTNDMFQLWRALTKIINLCLTGKTSGFERPRAPRKHKFHPRPDSPLYLPNEELVPGYLKFSAKGTKREVFGMPIPGSLITADIQEASYYQEYLENVAKHRRYLAGETGSDPDSPTPKPTKPARKPKSTAPKAPSRPSVSTPVTSTQPEPTSTPAEPQRKKRQALEESLKSMYDVPRGPLPPVVIRKPESGKYQPLPEVPRKGKAKVTEEQVAHDLLSLQKPKKKSHADQYIFQRRTSTPTGSSGHDEPSCAELGQSDSEEESKKVMPGAEEGGQGQARLDPGNAGADEQSMPSPMVQAGSDRKHMDPDVADVSPQPSTKKMDEGFTATAYPKVQENLKLTVEEHVLLEEPASSSGTLSSLQHLSKDISFEDLFFSDKPSEANNDKANVETEVESMVSVMIQHYMSSIPPMTSSIIDLTSRPESPKRISELEHIMANLIQENKGLEERLDKHRARLYTLEQLDIPHQKKSRELPKTSPGSPPHQPPPPSPPAGPSGASGAPGASRSSQVPPPPPPSSSTNKENLQMDKDMALDEHAQSSDDEDIRKPAWLILSSDVPVLTNNWASALASNYSPPPKDSLLAQIGDIATFMDWFCKRRGITELKPQDLEGPVFEIIKVFHPDVIHLQYQMEECHKLLTNSVDDSILRHNVCKPLLLGGPPGQVTIQTDFFFNKYLEYLRYGSKEECKYDIDAMYGISHWWFQRQRFYIDRHTSEGDRSAVKTHMRILSVVRIKVFSMYGYDYMKKIVLRRDDLNEHVIAERDFKYMYRSDFEDLYLLNLQGHLNHLPPKDKKILTTAVNQWTRHLVIRQRVEDFQLGIESYQTQLNVTKPRWDAMGFKYKHDYTVIDSPRDVIQDKYGVQMMMRFNEIHKFNDGTLQQIDEALDYRVNEFKTNRMNLGLNTRFWTKKDVDQSKAFMFAIQKRLKTRRIFCNLESFIGGRVRDGDYRLLKRSPICAKLFRTLMHILRGSKSQNRRDLPRDNPLVRVEVLRKDLKKEKCENKGRVPTEMELELEHTPSEDGNPARANIKQALANELTDAFGKRFEVEHKDTKKSNEMYYPRFTKVIIHQFMSKDPSIPRKNKVNWHYVRDDHMFTTIKLVSRHQNTQQFGAMLPIELSNADIKNFAAYKEYYAVATGATPPKTKASVQKTKSSFDTTVTPLPTAVAGPRLSTSAKGKQPATTFKAKNEGTGSIPGVLDVPTDEFDEELSWNSTNEEGDDDEGDDGDDGNGEENLGINVGKEEGQDEEDENEKDKLYRDVNINLGRSIQIGDVHTNQKFKDSHVTLTSVNPDGQQQSSSMSSQFVKMALLPVSAPTLTPSTIATITTTQQAPILPTTALSTLLQHLPNFGSLFGFNHRLKTLEANFSEFMQANQFAGASDRLRDEAQKENDEFLKIIDENMQKIINEQVKEQVKVKILQKIEQTVNEQLEAEVLTRSSNSSKTSYAVVSDLSEMELKKILIEKMEGNKSIHRSNEQRNLYKALVEAYKSDKIILDTYRDTVTLQRRRDDDADKDEEPFAGSDRGSKRRREGNEPYESATAEEPMQTTFKMEEPSHPEFETEVYKAITDQLYWVNTEGQQYPHNLLKPLPLIPNSRGRRVIPFDHFINNDLKYLRGGASSHKYTTSVTKTKAADYGHIKWIKDLVPRTMWIQEPSRIIAVTELKIVEWHNYKHLDWITVLRDDDKLYKFKEGDFKRLRIQDIEDMLLLLVQGKLTNLTVKYRFAFNVSLRMFTRSIVIQRRVEDLQLGVESYQKKLNLTKPDTYCSDLKHKETYIAYSNPRGFIYQNKDNQNMLMRIDELHKFSDGTLTDVRTALDDRLKGIQMKYLPQSI
nr:histone deacetylase 14 [Tanacetum cinerariifolium]